VATVATVAVATAAGPECSQCLAIPSRTNDSCRATGCLPGYAGSKCDKCAVGWGPSTGGKDCLSCAVGYTGRSCTPCSDDAILYGYDECKGCPLGLGESYYR
jgi:hypothetical protein